MKSKNKSNNVILMGQPVSSGIAIGHASLYQRTRPSVSESRIDESGIERHLEEFKSAKKQAEMELKKLRESQTDKNASELIQMQIEVVNDPDLCNRVKEEITNNNSSADSAVEKVFKEYLALMKQVNEASYKERAADIIDVRDRLIQILHDHEDDDVEDGTILIANELSPREVIQFSEQNVKGFVMDHGGATSHAAIIARSMNIPAVVGLKKATKKIAPDSTIILDGNKGEVVVDPDEETCNNYRDLIKEQNARLAEWEEICCLPNQTIDGAFFTLRANIELVDELESVSRYNAEGVGLLRTESLYLQKKNFRDQEKQQQFYRQILEHIAPHPLTIRLFDAGGDTFFKDKGTEHNPFLGWRGIRMLLDEKKLLKNQLRAILATAADYKSRVNILIPMVSSLEEVSRVKMVMRQVQEELDAEGVDIDSGVRLGIMVEVPSVALQANVYAKEVDFLSIGTNDLTQYALAVDRGNERISDLYDQRHPAVWKLIKEVADGTRNTDTSVSVCGELASDPVAACCMVGMGITDLSMSPGKLPAVKRYLRAFSMKELENLSKKILSCDTLAEIDQVYDEIKTQMTENS